MDVLFVSETIPSIVEVKSFIVKELFRPPVPSEPGHCERPEPELAREGSIDVVVKGGTIP
jgi:hypothetical protein